MLLGIIGDLQRSDEYALSDRRAGVLPYDLHEILLQHVRELKHPRVIGALLRYFLQDHLADDHVILVQNSTDGQKLRSKSRL